MSNPLNNGVLVGRVAQDLKVFPNADKSHVVLGTLAVDNNFLSGTGADRSAKTQFIPVRIFVPNTISGIGSWDRVHKGDLIAVQTRISCEPYTKNGETVFPEPTIEVEGFAQFLESKTVVEARAARKAVAATAPVAPAAETAEQTIARLQQEIVDRDATSPFATATA